MYWVRVSSTGTGAVLWGRYTSARRIIPSRMGTGRSGVLVPRRDHDRPGGATSSPEKYDGA